MPVSFTGPPSRIRELRALLQQGAIRLQRTVTVPDEHLNDARYDETLRLEPSKLAMPPGIHAVISENQNRLPVNLRRMVEKRLPVRFEFDPSYADRVGDVNIEPTQVTVRGPKEAIDRLDAISTQFYTIRTKPGSTEPVVMTTPEIVRLVTESKNQRFEVTPSTVAIRFTLKPPQKVHELVDVPVHFLCPVNFPFKPSFVSERAGKITLKVLGPAAEDKPVVAAYVDLTARKFGEGLHAEEPIRVQLPPGYQLVGEAPRLPSLRLDPLDVPMKPGDKPLVP
jgi:hypothetical protein